MPTRSGKQHTVAVVHPQAAPVTQNVSGLSAYELQRLENIKANENALAALNLTSRREILGLARPSMERGCGFNAY